MIASDIDRIGLKFDSKGWSVRMDHDATLPPQGYRLTIEQAGAHLLSRDATAGFYGQLTLAQFLALHADKSNWPALRIEDRPAYARRGAMIDLGRSVANLNMLKQLVRVFARLRYNELHLRLYDDELCSLRFEGLPFGSENPYALTLAQLGQLAACAHEHHVTLVPELESWGHVGSLVYHRPDLRGGDGMYAGSSFLAGPQAVELVGQLARQVSDASPHLDVLHLGFDEAQWHADPQAPAGYDAQAMLLDLDAQRVQLEQQRGHAIELRIWADLAGRPLPPQLQGRVTLQPWQYWIKNRDMMDRTIATYRNTPNPWMMCLGQSQAQVRGAYKATRHFCRQAMDVSNLQGITIALWGWNDWPRQLFTYFTGAYYAWNPMADSPFCDQQDEELFDQMVMPKMIWWQSLCDDADPLQLEANRGPLVWNGYHVGGPHHGQPVAPTVTAARTFPQRRYHDPALGHPEDMLPTGEVF